MGLDRVKLDIDTQMYFKMLEGIDGDDQDEDDDADEYESKARNGDDDGDDDEDDDINNEMFDDLDTVRRSGLIKTVWVLIASHLFSNTEHLMRSELARRKLAEATSKILRMHLCVPTIVSTERSGMAPQLALNPDAVDFLQALISFRLEEKNYTREIVRNKQGTQQRGFRCDGGGRRVRAKE